MGNFIHLFLGSFKNLVLGAGDYHVAYRYGNSTLSGVSESDGFYLIQHFGGFCNTVFGYASFNDFRKILFTHHLIYFQIKHGIGIGPVHKTQVLRNSFIEYNFTASYINYFAYNFSVYFSFRSHFNLGMKSYCLFMQCHKHFVKVAEYSSFAYLSVFCGGKIVTSQNHILSGNGNGFSVFGCKQIVCGKHKYSGFRLSLCRKRNVNSHLVSVKVRIVCGTYQRMQLYCSSLYKNRFKRLYSQSVQSRCSV